MIPWLYSYVLPVCILFDELDSVKIINCHPGDRITPTTLQEITFVYPSSPVAHVPTVSVIPFARRLLPVPGLGRRFWTVSFYHGIRAPALANPHVVNMNPTA